MRLCSIRRLIKTRRRSMKAFGVSKKPYRAERQRRRSIWTLCATHRRKVTNKQETRRKK